MRLNGAGGETPSPGFSPWIKAKPPTQTGKLREETSGELVVPAFPRNYQPSSDGLLRMPDRVPINYRHFYNEYPLVI